ncbi:hypothetical protein [Klenkia taihuensis]|uniref:Uncharacterized protein n=1 Tax=Klenkia taihuensis TaxID=1225127 RepID=A0A1I1Q2G7_9ACTN|nr:hypothetical protein [Klenkia taihuensis]GHE08180.1 hypothetical protein GCM10011381_07940 [Klenkia taihuensis]SFD16336.1 hypothetical protein SAMN05661030_2577 [Klenkia taihuensis]
MNAHEPASVVAARQLAAEAHETRSTGVPRGLAERLAHRRAQQQRHEAVAGSAAQA